MYSNNSIAIFPIKVVFLLLFVILLFIPIAVHSAPINNILLPSFKLPTNTDQPIVTFSMDHAMLDNEDPIPLLRIYADGKVKAHYPMYMKKAGDYQMQLSKLELMTLVRSLISDGIPDFNKSTVRAYTRQMDEQKHISSGEMFYESDASATVIDIRLQNYRSSPTAQAIPVFSRKFTWNNLQQQSRRYPGSSELTKAAEGANRLRALLKRVSTTGIK